MAEKRAKRFQTNCQTNCFRANQFQQNSSGNLFGRRSIEEIHRRCTGWRGQSDGGHQAVNAWEGSSLRATRDRPTARYITDFTGLQRYTATAAWRRPYNRASRGFTASRGVVGHQKGALSSKRQRAIRQTNPRVIDKALRVMSCREILSPRIHLLDTTGAYPARRRRAGQAEAIAETARDGAARVPV